MLRDLIAESKCRKGPASGTSKKGAFWFACKPFPIRHCGGDGIGQNGASVHFVVELRHYRSGEVQASIHRDAWHQNGAYSGGGDQWATLPKSVLDAETVEDVIVALKGYRFGTYNSEAVYSDHYEREISNALSSLGLPLTSPGPDEEG